MAGSLQPPASAQAAELSGDEHIVTSTGTTNDGKRVPGVTLIDPTTGVPYSASGGGGGGGGAVTLIDGADATQGASGDTAASLTIMGRLLKFAAQFPSTLGQKLSAASLGVVIASDQSAISTSITGALPAGTNALGSVNPDTTPGTVVIGSATSQAIALSGQGVVSLQILSTNLVGTFAFEATTDGTNWAAVNAHQSITGIVAATVVNPTVGTLFRINCSGWKQIRVRCSVYTSGTSTWQFNASFADGLTTLSAPLPPGANAIGSVGQVAQTPLAAALCTTVTNTTPSTGQSLLGYDGAITLELVAVGTVAAQAVTIQIEGSLDNTNWYIIGTAQIDATANPVYTAAAFTLTPGNGTIRHLYAVRDNAAYIRINPTVNTLVTGLSGSILANPV